MDHPTLVPRAEEIAGTACGNGSKLTPGGKLNSCFNRLPEHDFVFITLSFSLFKR